MASNYTTFRICFSFGVEAMLFPAVPSQGLSVVGTGAWPCLPSGDSFNGQSLSAPELPVVLAETVRSASQSEALPCPVLLPPSFYCSQGFTLPSPPPNNPLHSRLRLSLCFLKDLRGTPWEEEKLKATT